MNHSQSNSASLTKHKLRMGSLESACNWGWICCILDFSELSDNSLDVQKFTRDFTFVNVSELSDNSLKVHFRARDPQI